MMEGKTQHDSLWPAAKDLKTRRSPVCSFYAWMVLLTLANDFTASAQPLRPYAHTQSATDLRPASATLNGMVVPNSLATVVWFEWRERSGFTQITSPQNIGAGASVVRVTAGIPNLVPNGTYLCRVVASNALGVVQGAMHPFTTGNRVAAWGLNDSGQTAVPAGLSNVVGVAGGFEHSLALKSDGTVAAWGLIGSAQTIVPAGLSNVVALAGGFEHSLALKADGTMAAWGENTFGQANVPVDLSNVVAVASGRYHSLALRADGTLASWGHNSFGQATVPVGLSNVVQVACGGYHSLALKADGTVATWGYSGFGLANVPASLSNVVAVAAGAYHSLALNADGNIAAWGDNSSGQRTVPPGLSDVVALAAGGDHSLALKADGFVASWGDNCCNQPTLPTGLNNVASVAGGYYHSLAVANNTPPQAQGQGVTGLPNADLVVSLAGSDANGDSLKLRVVSLPGAGDLFQYANGSRGIAITSANLVVSDSQGRMVFAPATNAFGIPYASFSFAANDGEFDSAPALVTINLRGKPDVHTQSATDIRPTSATLNGMAEPNNLATVSWLEWGERGRFTHASSPTDTGAGSAVVRVRAAIANLLVGQTYQFRLTASNAAGVAYGAIQVFTTGNRVTAWGYNRYGQATVPAGLDNVVAVAAGSEHSLALKSDGTVIAWGTNKFGQLNAPLGLNNVVAVACGYYHNLALKADGTVAAWGYNASGQATVPPGLNNVVAVSAAPYGSLALSADGTVAAWGAIDPVPTGLSNVVTVAAGGSHNLALKADGTMAAWGNNWYGQGSVPAGLSNMVAVAAGNIHNAALRNDGTVVAWGYATDGALNVPAGLSNVIVLAAAVKNNLAIRGDGTVSAWGDDCCGQATVPAVLSDVVAVAVGAFHSLAVGSSLPVITSFNSTANGLFQLTFQGDPNVIYSVWGSSNLVSWSVLGPPTPSSPGVFQFFDSSTTNQARRFYRVGSP